MSAQFVGVGVGPGDPELVTLKAANIIKSADIISFIANEEGQSQAKSIARDILAERSTQAQEIPVIMPMCEDRKIANRVYDKAAKNIKASIEQGKQVVFLCEGDPLFFASFAYLLTRLQDHCQCQVIPGISSVHAASAALQLPLTLLKESFAIASGRHSEEQLVTILEQNDSVVIMKAGRSRTKILAALRHSQRLEDASYLEYIGRENEYIQQDVKQLLHQEGPYFSLFVVTRNAHIRDLVVDNTSAGSAKLPNLSIGS